METRSIITCVRDDFSERARREFCSFVRKGDFPCLGAKAAFNARSSFICVYDELGSDIATRGLAADLGTFTRSELGARSEYATFIAIFHGPLGKDEAEFEARLWLQLRKLNQIDAVKFEWDPKVESNPADPHFSFSFAGQALYVIGMHGNSSRRSRRFQWPTLVFNPHEQFERLRAEGKWKRMQEAIRARDIELQGNINPMLSDFGEKSEARQYSGRAVGKRWQPPFKAQKPRAPARCPFTDNI